MMTWLINALVKLIPLAAVWFTAFFIGAFAIGQFSDFFAQAYIAIALLIGSLVVSERILGLQLNVGVRDKNAAPRKAATIEPETLRLRDMIALLDEDDLDDLRAEVRETLRERIHRLSADETETFEALLSDSKRKRR